MDFFMTGEATPRGSGEREKPASFQWLQRESRGHRNDECSGLRRHPLVAGAGMIAPARRPCGNAAANPEHRQVAPGQSLMRGS